MGTVRGARATRARGRSVNVSPRSATIRPSFPCATRRTAAAPNRVASDQKMRISVPLHLTGHAPAVELGAVVLQNMDSIEIECFPDDMPTSIEIDISSLADVHARVTVHDLVLPKGVKLIGDYGDESLVSVTLPRSAAHEDDEEAAAAAAAQPEILTERKRTEPS